MPSNKLASLHVRVLDVDGAPLEKAKVQLSARGQPGSVQDLVYLAHARAHVLDECVPGRFQLKVALRGHETQERAVVLAAGQNDETVVLGKKGMRYYCRGRVRVPFAPRPELVGVKLDPRTTQSSDSRSTQSSAELLRSVEERLGVSEYEATPEAAQRDGFRVFQVAEDQVEEVLAELGRLPEVRHSGAVVGLHERSVSFLTDEIVVRFAATTSDSGVRTAVSQDGAGADVEVLRRIPYLTNTYHVRRTGLATYDVLDLCDRLVEREDVEWAEPNLVTSVELDQVTPADYLWPGVWDRQLIGTPAAWAQLKKCDQPAFGSPELIIAMVDQGIESLGGVPRHPDLQGEVSDGSAKVYKLYDFANLVPNNDAVLGDHGMGVTGVAAAKANNDSVVAGQDEGIAGAAPNCRVMGLIFPFTETDQLDMYVWAAGFDPGSPRVGFPAPISPGADIFSTSIGFGAGAPISGQAAGTFDFLVQNGRGGKGCLCFFSAGNADNDFTNYRPWAAYGQTFGMAASSLDDDGSTEIRAPYSGFGPAELCAPSHDEYVGFSALHNPPINYATWSLDLVGTGNLVGHAGVESTLAAAAAVGATQITVADATNFLAGSQVLIGAPGALGSEPATITGPPNVAAGTIPVSALINAHPAGTVVVSGANDYRNNFGGTSSATPLAAGAAALLLSADPSLSFQQARQVLRETSRKIDATNVDPVGQWLDEDNNPSNVTGKPPVFSAWYGYGRVDIEAAVKRVAKMKCKKKKKKKIYRYSVKFVCGCSNGSIVAGGRYWTAINVRNTSDKPIRFRKRFCEALPGERAGPVSKVSRAKLGPFEALEIDCPDIYRHTRTNEGCFLKGFAVLESEVELDVIAVYTAAKKNDRVETIDVEHVKAKVIKVEREPEKEPDPQKPRLPDLVPVPPFRPGPPFFPSLYCASPAELLVHVHNQGAGDAGPTTTRVEFGWTGTVVERDTPALAAGQMTAEPLVFPIPDGCTAETCRFDVIVNADPADGVTESDMTNNVDASSCGIAS